MGTRGGTPGGLSWGKGGYLISCRRVDGVRVEWFKLVRLYEDHAFPGFAGAEDGSRI